MHMRTSLNCIIITVLHAGDVRDHKGSMPISIIIITLRNGGRTCEERSGHEVLGRVCPQPNRFGRATLQELSEEPRAVVNRHYLSPV